MSSQTISPNIFHGYIRHIYPNIHIYLRYFETHSIALLSFKVLVSDKLSPHFKDNGCTFAQNCFTFATLNKNYIEEFMKAVDVSNVMMDHKFHNIS